MRLLTLRAFSLLLCFVVAVLLFLGANVKSHEAGLSVPDWPTSYGYNMFTFPIAHWVGGIFHEHVHRLVASVVGMLTVVLTIWTFFVERRRWVKLLTVLALVAVIIQGVLGGLTVLYMLPIWISSLHGTLAQSFFCLLILIAYVHSKEFGNAGAFRGETEFSRAAGHVVGAVFLQLILGNIVRHSEAALAVLDFPTMGGNIIPGFSAAFIDQVNALRVQVGLPVASTFQIIIHLLHRCWAVVVVFAVLGLAVAQVKTKTLDARLKRQSIIIYFLLALQIALGIFTVLTYREPVLASLHVVTGALLLAVSVLLLIRSRVIA